MFDELNQQIAAARQNVIQAELLQRNLTATREALVSERLRAHELRVGLAQEQADVARLARMSFAALLHTVLGDHPQRLAKEQQELLTAKLKFDSSQAQVALLKDEPAKQEQALTELGDCAATLQSLYARKETLLKQSDAAEMQELAAMDERQNELQTAAAEMQQAVQTGWEAAKALAQARDTLSVTRTMSTLDTMGADSIAAWKYLKIDEARDALVYAQGWLQHFQRELRDVQLPALPASLLNIDFTDRINDFALDGLLSLVLSGWGHHDWPVHQKITEADEYLTMLERQVREIVRQMQRELEETRAQLKSLQEARCQWLATVPSAANDTSLHDEAAACP